MKKRKMMKRVKRITMKKWKRRKKVSNNLSMAL
jgi:hypothetical protein